MAQVASDMALARIRLGNISESSTQDNGARLSVNAPVETNTAERSAQVGQCRKNDGQPAWAVRHEGQTDHQKADGFRFGSEHPSPVSAEREKVGCAHGQREPHDNGKLIDHYQAAAEMGRGDLGNVHGRNGRRQTHAKAAHKTPHAKLQHVGRNSTADGRDHE